jgi:hypothetical protein
MDVSQPLEPGMVDELAFAGFALGTAAPEGNVTVQGIVAQALAFKVAHARNYIGFSHYGDSNGFEEPLEFGLPRP